MGTDVTKVRGSKSRDVHWGRRHGMIWLAECTTADLRTETFTWIPEAQAAAVEVTCGPCLRLTDRTGTTIELRVEEMTRPEDLPPPWVVDLGQVHQLDDQALADAYLVIVREIEQRPEVLEALTDPDG